MYQLASTIQFGEFANLQLGLPELGLSRLRYNLELEKLTQEFRLSSKSGGRFEWLVGVFHTHEDAIQSQRVRLMQGDGSPLPAPLDDMFGILARSEEHTSELQSLMRISYAVFCLKKTRKKERDTPYNTDIA